METLRTGLVVPLLIVGCAAAGSGPAGGAGSGSAEGPGGASGTSPGGGASDQAGQAGEGGDAGAGTPPLDAGPRTPSAPAPGEWITVNHGSYLAGAAPDDTCNTSVNQVQHAVTLTHDFELSATEVTFAQYELAMGAPHPSAGSCPSCPVNLLSWHAAAALCNAYSTSAGLVPCYACDGAVCEEAIAPHACHGYRLPTEAEWEFAHRAGTSTPTYAGAITVCGGLDPGLDGIAWFLYNASGGAHPVGTKQANAWGFFDMSGNVWEWTHDGYVSDRSTLPQLDPVGPASDVRVMRGGSYNCVPSEIRAAHRSGLPAAVAGLNVGVRCARTLD